MFGIVLFLSRMWLISFEAESEEESSGDTGESDDAPDTTTLIIPGAQTLAPLAISENLSENDVTQGIILPDSLQGESSADNFDELYKPETTVATTVSSSSYTLKSTTSSDTLTPGTSPKPSPRISPRVVVNDQSCQTNGLRTPSPRPSGKSSFSGESLLESLSHIILPTSPKSSKPIRIPSPSSRSGPTSPTFNLPSSPLHGRTSPLLRHSPRSPSLSPKHPRRTPSPMSPSMSSPNIMTPHKIMQPCKLRKICTVQFFLTSILCTTIKFEFIFLLLFFFKRLLPLKSYDIGYMKSCVFFLKPWGRLVLGT